MKLAITFLSSPNTEAKSAATTKRSVFSSTVISITWYSTFGLTATAVFDTKVQGVVVQTNKLALRSASFPEVTGKRTKTDGSLIVS